MADETLVTNWVSSEKKDGLASIEEDWVSKISAAVTSWSESCNANSVRFSTTSVPILLDIPVELSKQAAGSEASETGEGENRRTALNCNEFASNEEKSFNEFEKRYGLGDETGADVNSSGADGSNEGANDAVNGDVVVSSKDAEDATVASNTDGANIGGSHDAWVRVKSERLSDKASDDLNRSGSNPPTDAYGNTQNSGASVPNEETRRVTRSSTNSSRNQSNLHCSENRMSRLTGSNSQVENDVAAKNGIENVKEVNESNNTPGSSKPCTHSARAALMMKENSHEDGKKGVDTSRVESSSNGPITTPASLTSTFKALDETVLNSLPAFLLKCNEAKKAMIFSEASEPLQSCNELSRCINDTSRSFKNLESTPTGQEAQSGCISDLLKGIKSALANAADDGFEKPSDDRNAAYLKFEASKDDAENGMTVNGKFSQDHSKTSCDTLAEAEANQSLSVASKSCEISGLSKNEMNPQKVSLNSEGKSIRKEEIPFLQRLNRLSLEANKELTSEMLKDFITLMHTQPVAVDRVRETAHSMNGIYRNWKNNCVRRGTNDHETALNRRGSQHSVESGLDANNKYPVHSLKKIAASSAAIPKHPFRRQYIRNSRRELVYEKVWWIDNVTEDGYRKQVWYIPAKKIWVAEVHHPERKEEKKQRIFKEQVMGAENAQHSALTFDVSYLSDAEFMDVLKYRKQKQNAAMLYNSRKGKSKLDRQQKGGEESDGGGGRKRLTWRGDSQQFDYSNDYINEDAYEEADGIIDGGLSISQGGRGDENEASRPKQRKRRHVDRFDASEKYREPEDGAYDMSGVPYGRGNRYQGGSSDRRELNGTPYDTWGGSRRRAGMPYGVTRNGRGYEGPGRGENARDRWMMRPSYKNVNSAHPGANGFGNHIGEDGFPYAGSASDSASPDVKAWNDVLRRYRNQYDGDMRDGDNGYYNDIEQQEAITSSDAVAKVVDSAKKNSRGLNNFTVVDVESFNGGQSGVVTTVLPIYMYAYAVDCLHRVTQASSERLNGKVGAEIEKQGTSASGCAINTYAEEPVTTPKSTMRSNSMNDSGDLRVTSDTFRNDVSRCTPSHGKLHSNVMLAPKSAEFTPPGIEGVPSGSPLEGHSSIASSYSCDSSTTLPDVQCRSNSPSSTLGSFSHPNMALFEEALKLYNMIEADEKQKNVIHQLTVNIPTDAAKGYVYPSIESDLGEYYKNSIQCVDEAFQWMQGN